MKHGNAIHGAATGIYIEGLVILVGFMAVGFLLNAHAIIEALASI